MQVSDSGRHVWDKLLSVVLLIAMLGALGYFLAIPKVGERFTEFYILGTGGKVADYPEELVVGQEEQFIVGILNHEHETVSYRVGIVVSGVKEVEVGPVVLEHEKKWEGGLSFVPVTVAENQKVEFLLYKQGQTGVYQSLHLWVDVID